VTRCSRVASVCLISLISRVIPTRPMTLPDSSWNGSLVVRVPVRPAIVHPAALYLADDGPIRLHDPEVIFAGWLGRTPPQTGPTSVLPIRSAGSATPRS